MSRDHRPRTGAAGHDVGEALYVPGGTVVHQTDPAAKILAALGFVLVVVLTPIQWVWPFAAYAGLILAAFVVARLPLRLMSRMAVEIPFVLFAVALPFIGLPPQTQVLGLTLSEPGLWAGANILVKATIAVLTSLVLAATTRSRDLLDGLRRLRVPALLVEIAGFMVRYVHVVSDEWRRMSLARASRGFNGRGPRAWPVLARSAAALFVRAYERGERVHLAMLSRGYSGSMPALVHPGEERGNRRALAAVLPVTAAAVAVLAWSLSPGVPL